MENLTTQDYIAPFLKSLSVNGASKNTLRAYKSDLMGLFESVQTSSSSTTPLNLALPDSLTGWTSSQIKHLEWITAEYLSTKRSEWSPNTLNRKLACFRKLGRFLGDPVFLAEYSKAPTPPPVAHPLPEGMVGVVAMANAGKTYEEKALVAMCGMLGLRIHEARTIRPSHFDMARTPVVLRFRGKGEKVREVPVNDRTMAFIINRIIECNVRDDRLVGLEDRGARKAISRLGHRALGHPVASHDLRMTFGTTAYYNSGGDIRATQELLGHSSSKTTENYTFVSMDKMSAASDFWGEDE